MSMCDFFLNIKKNAMLMTNITINLLLTYTRNISLIEFVIV